MKHASTLFNHGYTAVTSEDFVAAAIKRGIAKKDVRSIASLLELMSEESYAREQAMAHKKASAAKSPVKSAAADLFADDNQADVNRSKAEAAAQAGRQAK